MTATVTGSGPVTGQPAPVRRPAARRRWLVFPRGSTTPGKVRLIRMGLVIAGLGWGALAALMVGQHASAAADQVTFADSAAAGSGAFTGLQAGIVVLALIMAAGSAWGLSRRLAEYR
jgi:hypothetical protein